MLTILLIRLANANQGLELTTKEKIIEEAMTLFSIYGYESVSVRKIASKVGIRDSGLYKHFPSKKAIFDCIIETAMQRFRQRSEVSGITNITTQNLYDSCISMFKFQTQDEWTVKLRRILIIEQFHNSEMKAIYKDFFIDMPIKCQAQLFKILMEKKIMKKNDPIVLSTELFAPFFMYHTIDVSFEELLPQFKTHVDNFIQNNFFVEIVNE